MRRVHLWILVSALTLLAAGGVLGVLVGRRLGAPARVSGGAAADGSAEQSRLLPEYLSDSLLRSQVTHDELNLDDETRVEVRDLLSEHNRRARELRGELESLSRQTHDSLLAMLSPEQRRQFERIVERYIDAHLDAEAIRELVRLRREIALTVDQEPAVYQITFDFLAAQRDLFGKHRDLFRKRPEDEGARAAHEAFRREMEAISRRRLDRLATVLGAEQLADYAKLLEEREKRWRRDRERDKDKDKDRDKDRDHDRHDGGKQEPDAKSSGGTEKTGAAVDDSSRKSC